MPQITINNGEKTLEAKAGSKLLEALAIEDIVLPSACGGRGRCGMCKVRVFSGSEEVTELETQRLTSEQLENKWRLACQTIIKSDISIELPGQLVGSTQFECEVEVLEQLTYDIKGLRVRLPAGKKVNFKPGQYMQITAPAYDKLKHSTYRAYSISSSTTDDDILEFCIRLVPNGIVSTYVHEHLKVGDKVTLTGPYGEFYLRESDREIIFIAGGSGLSPVRSMIHELINKKITNRKVNFFFGACTHKDLYYVDEFKELEREHSWLHYIPALSDADGNEPECASGLITDVVDRFYDNFNNHEAYLCGGPGMINACLKVLTDKGMPESLIFYDKFA